MTIEEIEAACERAETLDFTRHALEAPELTLQETFYPLGFPMELRTNSAEIVTQARELWSMFDARFSDTRFFDASLHRGPGAQPIRVDVHVVEGGGGECPPAPQFQMMQPVLISVADAGNYSLADLRRGWTRVVISRATELYPAYLKYFFLLGAPMCHIATRYATPVHAGCVALDGRGLLLCGDSGAGKSSLSYACARAGWTYVTDDAGYLLHERNSGNQTLLVTGNCHQVRFRPSARELFPEVEGLEITPRAAGKPSIELPTAPMTGLVCAQEAQVDFLVFLNRRDIVKPELRPYCKKVARHFLRQVLFGPAESLAAQYVEVERLLTAEVFELRYTDLDWAVDRLTMLVREGR